VIVALAILAQALVPARDLGFDPRPGTPLPMETRLRDERGATLTLAEAADGRAFVLAFVYYRCPSVCGMVIDGLARSLRSVRFEPDRDYRVVLVGIDPREGPEHARARLAESRRDGGAGWRALTGDAAAVSALAGAAGFKYAFDPRSNQYAHPGGILLVTPQGRVSRAIPGVVYEPLDLRLGLLEASDGRIGSRLDTLALFCFVYDPESGRYGWAVMRLLRTAGIATAAALALLIWRLSRRRRAGAHG
jgi:protein SCO1/2